MEGNKKLYIATAIITQRKRVVVYCKSRSEFREKFLKAAHGKGIGFGNPEYKYHSLSVLSKDDISALDTGEVEIIEWWNSK